MTEEGIPCCSCIWQEQSERTPAQRKLSWDLGIMHGCLKLPEELSNHLSLNLVVGTLGVSKVNLGSSHLVRGKRS